MGSLYNPERHLSLTLPDWNRARVSDWLKQWANTALEHRHGWPVHPRDASDFDEAPGPLKSLYCGAAGVWLALARLAEAGFCRLPQSLEAIFAQVHADYTQAPDTGELVPSWFLGESSLLTACCLAGADDGADRLEGLIRANRENPTREALWGAPGTMIAALTIYEATQDARWAELFRDSATAIWASWFWNEPSRVWLWEQDMYGRRTRYVGAGHGWAGNLYPLWRGHDLLSPEQQAQLRERTLQGLRQLALTEGDLTNWPALAESPERLLVQWCHGSPGMITSLRHANLPEVLPLLIQGANLILAAGPLAKGVSLCHGTDGNGVALLEIYRLTQAPVWLEHARGFAMSALNQAEAEFRQSGQWRYSLWTGDAGLACFLLDCLEGRSRGMPGLDAFW